MAPNAQFKPIQNGSAFAIEMKKASVSCPERVLPFESIIVPDTITGRLKLLSSKYLCIAYIAALEFSVSKIVSTSSKSTPPSTRPCKASLYAITKVSKFILRKPGSFMSGDTVALRFVGPRTPATRRGFLGVFLAFERVLAPKWTKSPKAVNRGKNGEKSPNGDSNPGLDRTHEAY